MNRAGFAAALALLAAACGGGSDTTVPPDAITFVGADGVESVIADTSRVVVLNGDLTEVFFELGLGDRVVGVDVTTSYPPEAESIPIVGIGQLLVAEGVLEANPTLVVGDEQLSPVSALEQIREAGVPVVILPLRTELEEMDEKARDVARIMGVDGEHLATRIQGEIDEAVDGAPETSLRTAFVYVAGGGRTVLLFGSDTPTSSLLRGAGTIDAAADAGVTGAAALTAEALVAAAPDVIVTTDRAVDGAGGLDGFLALPGVAQTPAGRSGNLLVYDDAYILGFGPRAGQALAELIADLALFIE